MTDKEAAIFAMVVDGALKKLPTADLIAELEKRRPCGKCINRHCHTCLWPFTGMEDNFKEGK